MTTPVHSKIHKTTPENGIKSIQNCVLSWAVFDTKILYSNQKIHDKKCSDDASTRGVTNTTFFHLKNEPLKNFTEKNLKKSEEIRKNPEKSGEIYRIFWGRQKTHRATQSP